MVSRLSAQRIDHAQAQLSLGQARADAVQWRREITHRAAAGSGHDVAQQAIVESRASTISRPRAASPGARSGNRECASPSTR